MKEIRKFSTKHKNLPKSRKFYQHFNSNALEEDLFTKLDRTLEIFGKILQNLSNMSKILEKLTVLAKYLKKKIKKIYKFWKSNLAKFDNFF